RDDENVEHIPGVAQPGDEPADVGHETTAGRGEPDTMSASLSLPPARLVARHSTPDAGWRRTIAYALCLWVGYALWRGDVGALGWLVAVVFFLMMSAASNCWD